VVKNNTGSLRINVAAYIAYHPQEFGVEIISCDLGCVCVRLRVRLHVLVCVCVCVCALLIARLLAVGSPP